MDLNQLDKNFSAYRSWVSSKYAYSIRESEEERRGKIKHDNLRLTDYYDQVFPNKR